ncbi:unnamed protein product [Urochloa decumbens]|uniref:DUF4220 domain-containing protein n=1 Tax=Urochloa decumbens TaxID=240449 RepID=A0ABC9ASS8_9POAL
MLLVMFVMDIYRCRRRSSVITKVMEIAHALSGRIVMFLIGAMQSTGFHNDLFPVWAVVLASLQSSLGYLSGCSILDRERRFAEVTTVVQFIGSGVLNGTRPLPFTKPLWSLLAILATRSLYRFLAHTLAIKSVWHARSSEFLPEYLRRQWHRIGEGSQNSNSGCRTKYPVPVYGESKQKLSIQKPQYILHLDINDPGSLITLDKVFDQLPAHDSNRCRYEDMFLAFSLSRLVRCKLEDVPLHSDSIGNIQDLVLSKIIRYRKVDAESDQTATGSSPACSTNGEDEKAAGQAFRILELELAFLRDYFYTLYPMVFWRGLSSLCLSLLMSIATIAVTTWLAVRILQVYDVPIEDYFYFWKNGCNFDLFITLAFMLFLVLKEIWEMLTYLVSHWTRLLLVCKYVQSKCWCLWSAGLTKRLTGSFFTSEIVRPWHGRIRQYDFLQSYTYKPTFWKMAYIATSGMTPQKFDGKKYGNDIKIPECVKEAILGEPCYLGPTNNQLRRDIPSLPNPELFEKFLK